MIFYTIQGPKYRLEIHEDKIALVPNNWFANWKNHKTISTWPIEELSRFEIVTPKFFIISGKIQWQTFKGEEGYFRFTTTPEMVKKIETYLQKRVIKNIQQLQKLPKVS